MLGELENCKKGARHLLFIWGEKVPGTFFGTF